MKLDLAPGRREGIIMAVTQGYFMQYRIHSQDSRRNVIDMETLQVSFGIISGWACLPQLCF